MDHRDHVNLLRKGVPAPGGLWADLGAGSGAFTLALAELVRPEAEIFAVDLDANALGRLENAMRTRFPQVPLRTLEADFTLPLDLPSLDGVVMANVLHFHRDKEPILKLIWSYLRPGGRLLLVEYEIERGSSWVPYPITYLKWEQLAGRAGFTSTARLAVRPSRTFGQIYSAVSRRQHGLRAPGTTMR